MLNFKPAARTAILINSPEAIFLDEQNKRKIFVVVIKNSALAVLAKKNFSLNRIIFINYRPSLGNLEPPSLEVGDLLDKTDLTSRLLERQISYFCLPYRSSFKMERWSKKTGIKLAVTPLALQEKMENKRFFDNFLKRNRLPSPRTLTSVNLRSLISSPKAYVAQEAKASDYFRTKFHQSGQELARALKTRKIDLAKTVMREYLPGLPVGVSIFLDRRGNYFFSALRRQCFTYQSEFPKKFIGIQWLPRNFFPAPFLKQLNRCLANLTLALTKEGFYGVANVDLVIYQNQPFFIECNPRLSLSTPQVFEPLGLASLTNPWQFYLKTFTPESNRPVKKPFLPRPVFKGSILDMETGKTIVTKQLPLVGVYKINQNRVKFISSSLKDLKGSARFLLFHELAKGQELKRGYGLVTIFCHWPLFDLRGGFLNQKGQLLYHYFHQFFYE